MKDKKKDNRFLDEHDYTGLHYFFDAITACHEKPDIIRKTIDFIEGKDRESFRPGFFKVIEAFKKEFESGLSVIDILYKFADSHIRAEAEVADFLINFAGSRRLNIGVKDCRKHHFKKWDTWSETRQWRSCRICKTIEYRDK